MNYIIVSLLFSLFGIWLCYKYTKNIFSPVFFTSLYWFSAYIGGLEYYLIFKHYNTIIYISLGILFFGIGVCSASLFHSFSPCNELNTFINSNIIECCPKRTNLFYISIAISTVIFIIISLIWFYNNYSLMPIFQKGTVGLYRANLGINKGIYLRASFISLPTISGICLLLWFKYHKIKYMFIFIVTILISTIGYILASSRGGILGELTFLIILFGFTKKLNKKNTMIGISFIILGFILATGINFYSYGSDYNFIENLKTVFIRATSGQAEGIDYIIHNWVPNKGLAYGKMIYWDFEGLLSFLRIMPYKEGSFATFLFWDMFPSVAHVYSFSMVTILLGSLYADFGIMGIIIGSFLFGFFMQNLYVWTLRGVKDYLFLTSKIFIQYSFAHVALGGGFFSVAATNAITIILTLLIIFLTYTTISLPTGKIIWKKYTKPFKLIFAK